METLEAIAVTGKKIKKDSWTLIQYYVGQYIQSMGYENLRDYCIRRGLKDKALWAIEEQERLQRERDFAKDTSNRTIDQNRTKIFLGL